MDNDFFWNTIEHSKTISNEEMQELIAKIIAGEYNNPGSYSMSTLHILKMLGKNELELFEKIGTYLINEEQIPKIFFTITKNERILLGEPQIDFGDLQILQNLGLFLPNDMSKPIENEEMVNLAVRYFDKEIIFTPTQDKIFSTLIKNHFGLSIAGKQLIKHLQPKFNKKYFFWLIKNYKLSNYKVIDKNN